MNRWESAKTATHVGYNAGQLNKGISPDSRRTELIVHGMAQAKRVTSLVFRFATVHGQNVQWFLRRNCSITPGQLGMVYISLCIVSLGIGAAFWFHGAIFVLPFAGGELITIGVAFLVYARHAGDGERIYLAGPQLVVELESGGKTERAEFRREWVRVEPQSGDGSLIELSGQGRSINVGRFVRPELRPVLAREIRMALRGV